MTEIIALNKNKKYQKKANKSERRNTIYREKIECISRYHVTVQDVTSTTVVKNRDRLQH